MSNDNALSLRQARAADEGFVLRLEELAFRQASLLAGDRYVPRPGMGDGFPDNCRIICSEDDDVGCLTLSQEQGCIVVDQFYIIPSHQRRGLGRRVLSYLLEDAALHSKRVTVRVSPHGDTVRFFTEQGFGVVTQSAKSATLEWLGPAQHSNTSRIINA